MHCYNLHHFGPLILYAPHHPTKNFDDTSENSTLSAPMATLIYWFTIWNRITASWMPYSPLLSTSGCIAHVVISCKHLLEHVNLGFHSQRVIGSFLRLLKVPVIHGGLRRGRITNAWPHVLDRKLTQPIQSSMQVDDAASMPGCTRTRH